MICSSRAVKLTSLTLVRSWRMGAAMTWSTIKFRDSHISATVELLTAKPMTGLSVA